MISDEFRKELGQLINKHCMENESNTPDFILADYLCDCLVVWNTNVKSKYNWQGRDTNGNPLNKNNG